MPVLPEPPTLAHWVLLAEFKPTGFFIGPPATTSYDRLDLASMFVGSLTSP